MLKVNKYTLKLLFTFPKKTCFSQILLVFRKKSEMYFKGNVKLEF